jgi:hypothetical protein
MQGRDAEVRQDQPTGDREAPRGRGGEEHAAQDRRPEAVPDGAEQTAENLGLDDLHQRQPVDGEQGGEGVPGRLECRESEADRGTEDHAVAYGPGDQMPGQHGQGQQLDRFLDQPDADKQQR